METALDCVSMKLPSCVVLDGSRFYKCAATSRSQMTERDVICSCEGRRGRSAVKKMLDKGVAVVQVACFDLSGLIAMTNIADFR